MYSGNFDHGAALPPSDPPITADPAHLRHMVETLPAGAYTCDPDGLITYYNALAAEIWGRRPQLNHPSDRFSGAYKLFTLEGEPLAHHETWMAKTLRSGYEFSGREVVIERPDGGRAVVLVHANPVRDASGRLLGGANVLVDITDRESSQLALRLLADRQREDDRPRHPDAAAQARRILIADDHVAAAAHLATMLELMGHEVRVTHDGRDAVAIAAAFRPSVVFVNACLPHLDGFQVARRIRDLSSAGDACLIALIGWNAEHHPCRSAEAGIDLHWVKPIDPTALERLLGAPAFSRDA